MSRAQQTLCGMLTASEPHLLCTSLLLRNFGRCIQ